ncbi:MAG: hypothetical protein A3H64_02975 [Candidatus Ryanbacteria bacterium RIFCSPLOWO2_02_FULL_45_11c]|uniref:Uncharacterized protein n=1 Tax=Candidatus Ryanbacteria bacterium RIFCSPLOWO2_02_FULL_45_11c TaxID=1802128 RepID=A0A1G2H2H5_9BACT|nr:MAG: hypothetical protein A3H64_02975 [Candidatus Ryanbacteria bacterium RIFCSPLOWO2_02_FULL_45_11c]
MADYVTKKELEDVLDKKFSQYQTAIIGAIDFRFERLESQTREFDKKLSTLTVTLDIFLKHLTDWEDEFTILKAEVDQMKVIFKEKFGVEIAVQK